MNYEELLERWLNILRHKASRYEHSARKAGSVVSSPSIDDVCNELKSFFVGLGVSIYTEEEKK